jgi:hypothetical protein
MGRWDTASLSKCMVVAAARCWFLPQIACSQQGVWRPSWQQQQLVGVSLAHGLTTTIIRWFIPKPWQGGCYL